MLCVAQNHRLQAHRHCCLTWISCVKWNTGPVSHLEYKRQSHLPDTPLDRSPMLYSTSKIFSHLWGDYIPLVQVWKSFQDFEVAESRNPLFHPPPLSLSLVPSFLFFDLLSFFSKTPTTEKGADTKCTNRMQLSALSRPTSSRNLDIGGTMPATKLKSCLNSWSTCEQRQWNEVKLENIVILQIFGALKFRW